jgi:phenylalanyl-tRNA synthetase alpha chain
MSSLIQDWSQKIEEIVKQSIQSVETAKNLQQLEKLRVDLLGRQGILTGYLKELGKIPVEFRSEGGKTVHAAKQRVEENLEKKRLTLEAEESALKLQEEKLDVTLPGWTRKRGHLHPITQVTREIVEAFVQIGFSVHEGTEIETDYYNFEALNIPKNHPARDMQDTLYVSQGTSPLGQRSSSLELGLGDELLLRTHTSPIQIHVMKQQKPPLRVIAPGRVYRSDEVDASHSPMFHQVEGFMVGYDIKFSHLKYVLAYFAKRVFGEKAKVRFRPSFFPFVEPGADVYISCTICDGAGCRTCSSKGWLEVLGAGMVHPKVFEAVGYNPEEVTGFAFGMGIERITMLKYGIHDIRLFYENDARFLKQF